MGYKYNRFRSAVALMTDDELDLNLSLSRNMMREHANFVSVHGGDEEFRKLAISEFKWWLNMWSWILYEMKRRG